MEKPVAYLRLVLSPLPRLNLLIVAVIGYIVPMALWTAKLPARSKSIDVEALYLAQLWDTLVLSGWAAILAVLLGGAVACYIPFSSDRVARTLGLFMTVPLLLGFVARNYSWVGLLSYLSSQAHAGFFSGFLDSPKGIVIVMAGVFVPFCYFVMLQSANAIRAEYLEAARTLGASDRRIFLVVVLPNLRRGALLAFGLAYILGIGYFVTPQLIGGGNFPFIGNGVLTLLNDLGDLASASLLAFWLLLTVLVLLAVGLIAYLAVGRCRRYWHASRSSGGPKDETVLPTVTEANKSA